MTVAQLAPDQPDPAVGGELRLPRPPGVVRRFWAGHPRLADALIAGAYTVPTIVSALVAAVVAGQSAWVPTLAVVGAIAAGLALLLARRTRPRLVLGVAWAACFASTPSGSLDVLAVFIALYGLAVYGSTRAGWLGYGVSVALGALAALAASWIAQTPVVEPFDAAPLGTAAGLAVILLIATLIGVNVGARRRYLDALIARAHDLARERDQQARLAAVEERARIARELHDVVSHGLTVMITLADGSAATVGRDPARAADAMRSVADTGREALGEMRRMLGVLAEPSEAAADRTPQPGLAGVPALVDGFREAGLPVALTTAGPPITEPALQLPVYRIVQEGLTNALRHAAGARRVDVRIARLDDVVTVSVEDDGHRSPAGPATTGAGRGLAGLRERVGLYGGTLEAGPRGSSGWRLHATLDASRGPGGGS
ncbi:sensor histidine kinase [Agromyces sp. MMS24-JH15]|uniref:sensor histidine kinase n=1 Tax=Agromyces sp. MMS24-JH15 TaxID=3243765 RepID=UPI00374A666A